MIRRLILMLLLPGFLFAAEFTIKRSVTVEETGYSSSGDPVEAFENAIENAKRTAASLIEVKIKSGATTTDGRLSSDWVEKRANIQVFNVKVLEKTFVQPGEVRVRVRMTAGYLNYEKFWTEYDKTVPGATLRTVVLPGWGQIYNREYFSAGLYGAFYAAFYGAYILRIRTARDNAERDSAFVQNQLPALVFWTLAVSDASISRLMMKFGLEQIKKSYQAGAPADSGAMVRLDFPLWQRRF
jgi:hypothetical protein